MYQVINYLLATYTSYYIVLLGKADICNWEQPKNMPAACYKKDDRKDVTLCGCFQYITTDNRISQATPEIHSF